ncbi:MAG: hypothetical protein SGILL_007637 [Bacillariaceae sp.]
MIEYILKAQIGPLDQAREEDTYPILEGHNIFAFIGAKTLDLDNIFGGSVTPHPRPIEVGRRRLVLHPQLQEQFPVNYSIIRRLAYQAGVVQLDHGAFIYLWSIAVYMSSSLFCLLDVERCKGFSADMKTAVHRNLHEFAPHTGKTWIPIPRDLEISAQKLGLCVHKFYDNGGDGDQKREVRENYQLYWKHLSPTQQEQMYDQPDYDTDDDLDLNMEDYDSDSYCRAEESDVDGNSMSSMSFYDDNDDFSIYTENGGDISSDDDMEED